MNRHTLDAKSRKLVFNGPCLEVLPECSAMCCRKWDVCLLPPEYASGQYDAEVLCEEDNSPCHEKTGFCIHKHYRLKKREDGSCVYLNEESACSIYQQRPGVCRDFSCSNGWQLTNIASSLQGQSDTEGAVFVPRDEPDQECMVKVVFMPNPLIALKTVFYEAPKKQAILVVKHISKCTVTSVKRKVDAGQLTDEQIVRMYGLFNGKSTTEVLMTSVPDLKIHSNAFMELTGLFFSVQLLVPIVAGKQPANG
jgi:hypothetical protein